MTNVIVFLAFGTRGDVQPSACLASTLQGRCPNVSVRLVTHAAHEEWLGPRLARSGVEFIRVPSLPAREWGVDSEAAGQTKEGCAGKAIRMLHRIKHLEVCIEACRGTNTVVFNLFALEGFHLAEYYAVPGVALSSYLIPNGPPTGFQARLAEELPELYRALRCAEAGSVGWADVELWMWPLFLEPWGRWRSKRLRLPSVPFLPRVGGAPVALPPPTPLLLGFSERIIPRPQYWPRSATLCGFWHDPLAGGAACVPKALQDWVEGAQGISARLVYVGFGAVAKMGELKDPTGALRTLGAALALLVAECGEEVRALLVTEGATGLNAAWRRLAALGTGTAAAPSDGAAAADLELVGGIPWPDVSNGQFHSKIE